MPVAAFYEGPAGCGKTTRLMTTLEEMLAARPLADGHRVLALTFMNGARRRLDARLRTVRCLRGRYDSVTLDHLAWEVRSRWRLLVRKLGYASPDGRTDFDAACDEAGAILERPRVASWLAASYPIVLLDEAQDLVPERLRMVRALAASTTVVTAADEFQCLNDNLRPNPAVSWLTAQCLPSFMAGSHRTTDGRLLQIAERLRRGAALSLCDDDSFALRVGQKKPLSTWYVGNALRAHRWRTAAIISPTRGPFPSGCIDLIRDGPVGKRPVGPYSIAWELDDSTECTAVKRILDLPSSMATDAAIAHLDAVPDGAPIRATISWLRRQRDVGGRKEVTAAELLSRLDRAFLERRRHVGPQQSRLVALTVHQAKNREFDGVIVLWGFDVKGDAEQKCRLLYNAVTRARCWCEVIAQGEKLLEEPPFA